jgi:CheY-like chemotaxis protein
LDTEAVRFRVLLAEDDPVSRAFLREAGRACSATITDCSDGRQALARARADEWDLLILDHHLPGLDGDVILATLRADPDAASRATPAIATSAAAETTTATLQRAGFAEVLPKPMRVQTLRAALHRQGCVPDTELDVDDALHAWGSRAVVTWLGRLFAELELPRIQDELARAGDDLQSLQPSLHRLRASCGFCGARALADASAALHRATTNGLDAGRLAAAREVFRVALAETRAALHAHLDRS